MIKRKLIKTFICLLAVILAGGIYSYAGRDDAPLSLTASAVYEPYKMTDEYKSSKFYKNLSALELSGDDARDVLAIAMSQIGYHEGDSNADMHGGSLTGSKDFVEYNVLAGKYDNNQGNGLSYGYYWCASFVNWCLRMAGVGESVSGSEVSCQRWYDDCKSMGIFNSKSGYLPRSGDIIFFRDSGSLVSSTHVGLVRYSDGAYVYTVEGNTSSDSEYSSRGEYVALKSYPLNSKYIVGYASPRYSDNKTAHTVDHSGSFLSLGQYISKSEISIYEDQALKIPTDEKIPHFSLFSIISISDGALGVKHNGRNGYIKLNADIVQLTTNENIYVTSYLDDNGYMLFLPQYRRAGEQRAIYSNRPQSEDRGFVKWINASDTELSFDAGDKLPDGTGDITLTATWDTEVYTVEFKTEDGVQIEQFTGYYGTPYTIPSITPPKGQIFTGWDAQADGVIRGNAVYTAVFVPEGEQSPTDSDTDTSPTAVVNKKNGCTSSLSYATIALFTAIAVCVVVPGKRRNM